MGTLPGDVPVAFTCRTEVRIRVQVRTQVAEANVGYACGTTYLPESGRDASAIGSQEI